MASISVVDAAREAAQHTRRHLLPLSPLKWLTLGFLAFLDQCGRSVAGSGPHGGNGMRTGPWPGPFHPERGIHGVVDAARTVSEWLSDHSLLVMSGVAAAILAVAAVLAVFLWINSRGTFMYLDNVASGRAEIARPWREHAGAAWSYFGWRYALSFGSFMVFVLVVGIVLASVLGVLNGRIDSPSGGLVLLALVPIVAVLLLSAPILALALVALRDFVAPLQMSTGLSCGSAAGLLETLITAQPGAFIVYALLKLLFVVLSSVVVAVVSCLTCCIGFLPVVNQTIFQPLYYFERAWPLFLLRQLGYDLPGRLPAGPPQGVPNPA
jgi:hypothetical protein